MTDILEFVADYVRNQKIDQLEQADTKALIAKLVLLFLLCAFGTMAQQVNLPENPVPHVAVDSTAAQPPAKEYHFNRKVYFTGISVLAAAKSADVITTRILLDNGGIETNQLLGRHPSPAQQAGFNLAFFAAQSGVFYLTERSHHKTVRWIGRAWLAGVVTSHAELAACNASINPHGTARCSNPLESLW